MSSLSQASSASERRLATSGFVGREIAGLADVGGKIEELGGLVLAADKFPPAFADGTLLAPLGAPEQAIVRRRLRLPRKIRDEVHAVVLLAGGTETPASATAVAKMSRDETGAS